LAARNVLLRKIPPIQEDQQYQCVITDFGMARFYNSVEQYQKTKTATFPLRVCVEICLYVSLLRFLSLLYFGLLVSDLCFISAF